MDMPNNHLDQPAIEAWLVEWMGRELDISPQDINREATFLSHGMNSMTATMLVGDLEELLDRRLSPTLAWDYSTVASMANHLAGCACSDQPSSSGGASQ